MLGSEKTIKMAADISEDGEGLCPDAEEFSNQQSDRISPLTKKARDAIDASRITRHVYLGSYEGAAQSREGLKLLGIKYNLMIGHSSEMPLPFPEEITYKFIELPDHHTALISEHFDECLDFIGEAVGNNSAVLVNCWAGVSRSATIVIAFLIRTMCLNYLEAFETVRKARHWINPNKGFREQLMRWSESLGRDLSMDHVSSYEYARLVLRKLHESDIGFQDEMKLGEIFHQIFGTYHVHSIDLQVSPSITTRGS